MDHEVTSVLAGAPPPTRSIAPPPPDEATTFVPSPTVSRSTLRGRLGAGLVEISQVPYRDPASAILQDPVVAENKRFCPQCAARVGRGELGQPGNPEGVCHKCGTSFSFSPKLHPGEVVADQYEVLGALAYGGLGWIYLAQDHNVSDRWVVLKGLINTNDPNAMVSAVNEQRFLAQVEHPNIVKIYNFVQHVDVRTGNSVGYIVMEYVGGQSLRQLALRHHRKIGRIEPLPLSQVIAYGLEILPALSYLHGQELLYCDLKPDNVIQTNEQLKLIDLGAVRRIGDYESPLFFTTGYSAPELTTQGASIASDLYTVGRTLAVLSFEFTGYTSTCKNSLPSPAETPLFARCDSYHRFLKRATHTEPDRRFSSAAEMADQLTGVLRELVSAQTKEPRAGISTVFGPETKSFGVNTVVSDIKSKVDSPANSDILNGLPVPQVNTDDVGAGVLATTMSASSEEALAALSAAPAESIEVRLRVVRSRIDLGEPREASRQLQGAQRIAIQIGRPHDWRLEWYRGLIELAGGRERVAQAAFDAVYDSLPGELAPKLALAAVAERLGNDDLATTLYRSVWQTDRSYISAAFGLARILLTQGKKSAAIETLDSVPSSSIHHTAAHIAAIRMILWAPSHADYSRRISPRDISSAADRLAKLPVDTELQLRLTIAILHSAREIFSAAKNDNATFGLEETKILGYSFAERDICFGLEKAYRSLARFSGHARDRIALVDKANAIRPRTIT